MNMIKRIGILTGGGDCPGLNPTIRGAVYRAQDYNYEVYGIQEGWKGLVKGDINPLNMSEVREIVDRGGTILGTSRLNPYKIDNGIKQVLDSIKKFKLDVVIAIGGEDTLGVANKLFKEENVKLVGAPKTWIMILVGLIILLVSIVQLPGQLRRCEAFKIVDALTVE